MLTSCGVLGASSCARLEDRTWVFESFLLTSREKAPIKWGSFSPGGESGIRTHGTVSGTLLFESSTFNHSVTSPLRSILTDKVIRLRSAVAGPSWAAQDQV
jgi:hypothetical protein